MYAAHDARCVNPLDFIFLHSEREDCAYPQDESYIFSCMKGMWRAEKMVQDVVFKGATTTPVRSASLPPLESLEVNDDSYDELDYRSLPLPLLESLEVKDERHDETDYKDTTEKKILHAYYANLQKVKSELPNLYNGGYVLPPNMTTEVDTTIICPESVGKTLKIPLCKLLPENQFGGNQLLFHGTCDPDTTPFLTNSDKFRWYAFESNMSLDFIKEEQMNRHDKNLPAGSPTLYVYRLKKPIQNLMLFADVESWSKLGGHQKLIEDGICSISVLPDTTPEGNMLKKKSKLLGSPPAEVTLAEGVRRFKVMRGDRSEICNGWVRLNSIGKLGRDLFFQKGFELLLNADKHEDFLELLDVFEVMDSPERYGHVGTKEQEISAMDWLLA